MHMKSSHILMIGRAAASLCATLFLCACTNEIEKGDGDGTAAEFATVTFSVTAAAGDHPLSTKGMTEDEENAITTLYILAFQPDPDAGDAYKLKYNAAGKVGSGGSFSFTLRRSVSGAADTRLLLVANRNPFASVSAGMTYGEAQSALISGELGTAPAFADTGIPMFGFAGDSPNTPLAITEGMAPLTANLLRAVARVDVGVGTYNAGSGTWDKSGVPFNLTDVFVYKPYDRYALLPIETSLLYTSGTPSVTAASQAGTLSSGSFTYTGTAITDNTYCKAEIYLPEVALAGSTVYDENHENRTALVIGGHYNRSGSKSYYRIDFTTDEVNTDAAVLHDVLRNHLYRYSITAVTKAGYDSPDAAYSGKGIGLVFTTASITPWETGTTASVKPNMLVHMDFNGENGTIKTGGAWTVSAKKDKWSNQDGKQWDALDYNTLLGEAADNLYTGLANGGYYNAASNAFEREGPAPKLVIAPENAGQAAWRTGSGTSRVLNAKQLCRDYRGQGRSDWRLPRLSELYLLYLNRVTIESSKGFTPLGSDTGTITYWSASEKDAADAWTVNSDGAITASAKGSTHSVRCVREIR